MLKNIPFQTVINTQHNLVFNTFYNVEIKSAQIGIIYSPIVLDAVVTNVYLILQMGV
jgi:hypothetical protein